MIYLASPYSHEDRLVMAKRFELAAKATAALIADLDEFVYSPIVHGHPLACCSDIETGFEYWQKFDEEMIELCIEVFVLAIDGWETSKGVQSEIGFAHKIGRPVYYINQDLETL